jgi:YVTN family beta-propeller protein
MWPSGRAAEDEPGKVGLRRPVAMALVDGGRKLLVANRDRGTISAIDTTQLKIDSEVQAARRLSHLVGSPKGVVAVTDQDAAEMVLLRYQGGALQEERRLQVGLTPVNVQVSEEGTLAAVACLWPRRLVLINLTRTDSVPINIDLPFAPRCLLLVPGRPKLIVADAFGGNLAVVDVRQKKIDSVRSFPIHNIRGLALDRQGRHLLLTHQMLNARGHTVAGDIRAGNVIDNNVRKLALADVLDPWADVSRHERVYPLGDVERGAGDPAEVAESYDGHILVTLAGVDELAIGRPEEVIWSRLPVGRRPTALITDVARKRAYVANTFADCISVIDLTFPKVIAEVPLGGSAPPGLEQRGEMLFYDARLSLDGWYSCHSCHPDGHSNGRLNDNLSDGSFGTPKRVLSLLGVKDTGPWAWNGHMTELEGQVRSSVKTTMQGPAAAVEQVRDLTAFLRTLGPPPGMRKARGTIDAAALKRGRQVFARQKCATCHTPPLYTSIRTYDIGLRDEVGGKEFNPPSLRGVSQAGPYFHDNRALSLAEIFTRFRHKTVGNLSPQELADLLYFLEYL